MMRAARPTPRPAEGLRTLNLELLAQKVRIEAPKPSWLEVLARGFEPTTPGGRLDQPQLHVKLRPPRRPAKRLVWEVAADPVGALEYLAPGATRTPVQLVSALNLWAVQNTDRHYVFHAGAVVHDGAGVLLPAASLSGKSTLTAGLVRRGFELLSDEVGAVDLASGTLVGYPRALSLRRDVLELLELDESAGASLGHATARMVRVAALGGVRAEDGAEPRLVVLPHFQADSATCRGERLRPALAAMGLLESSCSQPRLKEAGLDFVLDLARRLPCYRLSYSDLNEAVTAVSELLAEVDRP